MCHLRRVVRRAVIHHPKLVVTKGRSLESPESFSKHRPPVEHGNHDREERTRPRCVVGLNWVGHYNLGSHRVDASVPFRPDRVIVSWPRESTLGDPRRRDHSPPDRSRVSFAALPLSRHLRASLSDSAEEARLSGRPIRLLHRFLQCLEGQRGALSPIVSIGE